MEVAILKTAFPMKPSHAVRVTSELASPPTDLAAPVSDPNALFCETSDITVLARVENWALGWAGRISCTLRLPSGCIAVTANRETLPLEIQDGNWIRARLSRCQEAGGPAATVVSANALSPKEILAIESALQYESKNSGATS